MDRREGDNREGQKDEDCKEDEKTVQYWFLPGDKEGRIKTVLVPPKALSSNQERRESGLLVALSASRNRISRRH